MKVFIDTPLVVASVCSNGLCDILLEALMIQSIPQAPFPGWQLRTSVRVLDESCRVLSQRLRMAASHIRARMDDLLNYVQPAPFALRPIDWQDLSGLDERDGWLLADALCADCQYIITADANILRHYAIEGMRTISPREAMDLVIRGLPFPRPANDEQRAQYLARRLESVV